VTRARAVVWSLAAMTFILGACSASEQTLPDLDPATTTGLPVTSSTTEPVAPCPTAAESSSEAYSVASVDVDGDGIADTIATEFKDDGWFLIVEYGRGGTSELGLIDADPGGSVRVLGGADFMADGREDVALVVGGGAYTQSIGFARSRDCELTRLVFEDSTPATFLVGSSVANFSGILCSFAPTSPPSVEQYFFSLVDGAADEFSFAGSFAPYELNGGVFVAGPGDETVLSAEELQRIGVFDCGDLSL